MEFGLFIRYIQDIINAVVESGCAIANMHINILAYADDLVLILNLPEKHFSHCLYDTFSFK